MATKKIEIQDSNGNVYYPHTDASVVKNGSKTVAEQLNERVKGVNHIYTDENISELGLTLPCTCSQLATSLASGDIVSCDASNISDKPTSYGSLFVRKNNPSRVEFEYRDTNSDTNGKTTNMLYIASYRLGSTTQFSGWKRILDTDLIINNSLVTEAGFALDARQGKILQDSITYVDNYSTRYKGMKSDSTIDLNSFLTNGTWYFGSDSSFVNAPNGLTFFLLTVTGNNINKALQEITSVSVISPQKYYRIINNGVVGEWLKATYTTV